MCGAWVCVCVWIWFGWPTCTYIKRFGPYDSVLEGVPFFFCSFMTRRKWEAVLLLGDGPTSAYRVSYNVQRYLTMKSTESDLIWIIWHFHVHISFSLSLSGPRCMCVTGGLWYLRQNKERRIGLFWSCILEKGSLFALIRDTYIFACFSSWRWYRFAVYQPVPLLLLHSSLAAIDSSFFLCHFWYSNIILLTPLMVGGPGH